MSNIQSKFNINISSDLIKQAQSGQRSAHELIFLKFSSTVYNLALKITNNRHTAEDILQETFVTLIKKIDQFRFESPFGMWLRSIAVNQILMHIRKNSIKDKSTDSIEDENILNLYHLRQNNVYESSNTSKLQNEMDLESMLSKLPVKVRTILWLKEVEGYTHQEIGDMMNKTASYSKSLVARAYHHLSDKYKAFYNLKRKP